MPDTTYSVLTGFGGLSLFLYGILLLSDGLKEASGNWFRNLVGAIASSRLQGYLFGAVMGTTVQSSATTVMIVGLINAGLLTLSGSIPLIAGANLGTTFAMQFIAFDVAWLWSALALAGLPLRLWPGNNRRQRIGQALIGLGLLLLGMRLMSQSLYPFRDTLSGWLAGHDGQDWLAFVVALAGSLAFTAVIQSSSATIGILFSLSNSGVLTSLDQAFPLILGAHIGTCATALLGSIGTGPEARRGALSHLAFNIVTTAAAIILMPWMIGLIESLGHSPTRNIAHAHMLVMLAGGILIVPLSSTFARLVRFCTPFVHGSSDPSQLEEQWIENPARALDAGDRELARVTRMVRLGFALNRKLAADPSRKTHRLVKQSEESVDMIRDAMRRYLMRVAPHVQTSGDARRLQWMNLFLIYLERISDHNDNLADLSMELNEKLRGEELAYARETCDKLYASIEPLLKTLEETWSTDRSNRRDQARRIRDFRGTYLIESENRQADIVARIAANRMKAITGFIMTEYVSELDRIVRHTKKIAGLLERSSPVAGNA